MKCFIGKEKKLDDNTMFYREPVQINKDWSNSSLYGNLSWHLILQQLRAQKCDHLELNHILCVLIHVPIQSTPRKADLSFWLDSLHAWKDEN